MNDWRNWFLALLSPAAIWLTVQNGWRCYQWLSNRQASRIAAATSGARSTVEQQDYALRALQISLQETEKDRDDCKRGCKERDNRIEALERECERIKEQRNEAWRNGEFIVQRFGDLQGRLDELERRVKGVSQVNDPITP